MRFRPEQHVRRQRDFRNLRENGRRLDCGGFAFCYCRRAGREARTEENAAAGKNIAEAPAPAPEIVRLGVVASYAAVGKAVSRARAKRRLREVFRRHQQLVPPGHDVLLIARRQLNRLGFPSIEQQFADACRRAFSDTPGKQPPPSKPKTDKPKNGEEPA